MTSSSEGCVGLVRALALGAVLAFAAQARAQVDLEWTAPPPCPTRDAVAAQITRLLAGSTAARSAQKVVARASVRALEPGYALQLSTEMGGERGERTLQAPSCAELAAASAVIVALLVDPEVVNAAPSGVAPGTSAPATSPPGPAAEPASPSPPPPPSDEPDADTGESSEEAFVDDTGDESGSSATGFSLRPRLVLDIGSLPRPAFGPGLAIAVHFSELAVELSGEYLPRQPLTRGGRTLAELSAAAGALALCYTLPRLPALSPCARAAYGRIWGRGLGVLRDPDQGGAALLTGELSLAARLPLSRVLWLAAEAGLALPLRRPVFTVQGVGEIHEPAVPLVRARAGLEVRL